jgi:hypothetical protein
VGDDNVSRGGGCGGKCSGLATVMVSAALVVERKTVSGAVSVAEQGRCLLQNSRSRRLTAAGLV